MRPMRMRELPSKLPRTAREALRPKGLVGGMIAGSVR